MFFSLISLAQKEGTSLTFDDPLCKTWELIDENEKAPIIAGIQQKFISLTADTKEHSFLARGKSSSDEFECLTLFSVSRDEKYLYLQILVPCDKNLPLDAMNVKVEYNLGTVKKVNTIEINGSKLEIEEMKSILTLTIDGENYHYGIIE